MSASTSVSENTPSSCRLAPAGLVSGPSTLNTVRTPISRRGPEAWRRLAVPSGDLYAWIESSTYIREPTYFDNLPARPAPRGDIVGAPVLGFFGELLERVPVRALAERLHAAVSAKLDRRSR